MSAAQAVLDEMADARIIERQRVGEHLADYERRAEELEASIAMLDHYMETTTGCTPTARAAVRAMKAQACSVVTGYGLARRYFPVGGGR